MQNTYIIHCIMPAPQSEIYTTLTITGEEANVVKWLQNNVEDIDGKVLGEGTMQEYLAAYREYMEETGCKTIWDVFQKEAPHRMHMEELECFVNGYEWADDWDDAESEGMWQLGERAGSYKSVTITV